MKTKIIKIICVLLFAQPLLALAGDKPLIYVPPWEKAHKEKKQKKATKYYFSGSLGLFLSHGLDIEKQGDKTNNAFSSEAKLNTGFSSIVAIGKRFGRTHRLELEYGFRHSELNSLEIKRTVKTGKPPSVKTFKSSSSANATGSIKTHSLMANIFSDFRNRKKSTFIPYIGAGLGVSLIDYDIEAPRHRNDLAL